MKNLILRLTALSFIMVITLFSACRLGCQKGSGKSVSLERKVENFTSIDVSGGYKIILKQDSTLSLKITADDNLMNDILTDVSGDNLKIYSKKDFCAESPMTIVIGVKNLEKLKGSGAIEFATDGKLNVKDLFINLSGAGKVDLDINATNLNTKGSGATEVNLKGQAASHTVNLTGTGKISALELVVGTYELETTGASECKINVMNELNVHTTGAAEISYRGNPAHVNSSKTGAADIKKIE